MWIQRVFCCSSRKAPDFKKVNYHQVDKTEVMSIFANNEFRTICTQTDPVNTSDEDEDLYEELDFPDLKPEIMEQHLTLDLPVDYEEVELKRSASCQRLGLTLCYGGTNERDTDIFVSQIEPNSVAERCGRLYVGDQILQINGTNVRSRQEAMSQFARESERIILLLARPSVEHEEDEEEEQIILETNIQDTTKSLMPLPEHDDSTTENSQAHEKDSGLSGLSRTTDSEPEQLQKAAMNDQKSRASMERSFESELAKLHSEMENIRLECARLMNQRNATKNESPNVSKSSSQAQQALSLMSMIEKLSSSYHQTGSLIQSNTSDSTKVTVIERKSQGTETPPPINHQPTSFVANFLQTPKMSRKNITNNSLQTPRTLRRQQKVVYDQTSSAYGTGGDSCRSTPNIPPPRRPVHLTVAQKHIDVGPLTATTPENQYQTIETPIASTPTLIANQFRLPRFTIQPPIHQSTKNCHQQRPVQPQPHIGFQPGQTAYITPDKLADTIALQQRLLREAVGEPGMSKHNAYSYSYTPQQNEYHTIRTNESQTNYEWKVKRRADGSRYITRRPLRSQVLKAREEQLNRERTGLSTDDDAASELKIGKFWSRQERKEHIQKQREKKLKKHQLLSQKQKYGQTDLIHELSHRKQMRHSGQQFFDKFTTIQEFLTHGARDPALRPVGGILSVTTV